MHIDIAPSDGSGLNQVGAHSAPITDEASRRAASSSGMQPAQGIDQFGSIDEAQRLAFESIACADSVAQKPQGLRVRGFEAG
ncbi:hypothetical protein RQP53_22745 [Paucibacter sp. APW11]|uniref:Uncharacterized protein n=1 Tax=Roseateles aquae TaxID=3077235 RepID=A0ABU3PHR0_9BURK|nr:hypothetical protein [Paucibacter sp. APW11]MDT9002115.1 hypothetical protein [Paucibacter sp. APW11]